MRRGERQRDRKRRIGKGKRCAAATVAEKKKFLTSYVSQYF